MTGVVWFDTTISDVSPDAEKIAKLTGGTEVVALYFNFHGQLPSKVKMSVQIPEKAGKTLNLYYSNTEKNCAELIQQNIKAIQKAG